MLLEELLVYQPAGGKGRMKVWTLAYDDKANGTGCELFATEREASLSLIERVTEEDSEERTEAMRLLDSDDEADDLWDYLQKNYFTMAGTALRNAEVFIGEELERRQQSGLPPDDPYLAEAHQALDLITAALGGQL
jgi:hypothetical protein